MGKRILKKLASSLLALSFFVGVMVPCRISAAGPDNSQKTGAKQVTLGKTVEGITKGSTFNEMKSEYYSIKTKRAFDLTFTVISEFDVTGEVEILVWNNKGELIRSGTQSKANWKYDKETNTSKDKFTIKNLAKGSYYAEVREKDSLEGRKYTILVVPRMVEKVKNVTAKQKTKSNKRVTVNVKWTPLKGITGSVAGYQIYVKNGKNGKYKLAKKVYSIKTKSVNIKLDAGKTYYIRVKAFYFSKGSDLEFSSRYSKEIKITTKKKG